MTLVTLLLDSGHVALEFKVGNISNSSGWIVRLFR